MRFCAAAFELSRSGPAPSSRADTRSGATPVVAGSSAASFTWAQLVIETISLALNESRRGVRKVDLQARRRARRTAAQSSPRTPTVPR